MNRTRYGWIAGLVAVAACGGQAGGEAAETSGPSVAAEAPFRTGAEPADHLIDANEKPQEPFAVSEWAAQGVPGYMVYDGRWKFMVGRTATAPSLDALYDLQNDPNELNNLIGQNPRAKQYRSEIVRMKGLLVEWLTRVKSPNLESVKARPLFAAQAR